jgi:CheY-like chemotaxis protein
VQGIVRAHGGWVEVERLPPLGFAVEWRTSGPEALTCLATDEFDAVLTDLNMREMNGLDLHLRSSNPQIRKRVADGVRDLDELRVGFVNTFDR